jgi:uncharacterized protein (TIGR01777 family)
MTFPLLRLPAVPVGTTVAVGGPSWGMNGGAANDGGGRTGGPLAGAGGGGGSNEVLSSGVSTEVPFAAILCLTVPVRRSPADQLDNIVVQATYPVHMRILMSGASGLIGTALCSRLVADGHSVTRLVRRTANAGEVTWDPAGGTLDVRAFDDCDAVINLSGAGIGDKRWTDDYKKELLASRVQTTELLATTMAALDRKPSVLLSGSAVGWYGDRGDERLDELSTQGNDFLSGLCQQWEEATSAAEAAGIRTVHLRTGIVLSAQGGALKKQLPLFKLGLGGRFGNGHQWQSWISIDDEVGAITHLLSAEICGPVNLTAINPVTNLEFTAALAKVLHRPAVLPTPMFAPKMLLGNEMVEALLLSSQRVLPTALQRSGYEFQHATVDDALGDILHRR